MAMAEQAAKGVQLFSRCGKNILRSLRHAAVLPLKEDVQCHAFFAAAMEEPEKFAPTLHVAFEEKPLWVKLADGLPTLFRPDYTRT
jgi:hypothetical protein